MTTKLAPADRKKQILDEALRQAAKVGYQHIKRADIATALEVSPALVSNYFSTMAQLKRDVMRAAIVRVSVAPAKGCAPNSDVLRVVAQGLAAKDRHAMRAHSTVKEAALATLA